MISPTSQAQRGFSKNKQKKKAANAKRAKTYGQKIKLSKHHIHTTTPSSELFTLVEQYHYYYHTRLYLECIYIPTMMTNLATEHKSQ